MPRLLVGTRWFDAVASQSWYEFDFERVVVERAADLYPRWTCVPFRESVEGDEGVRKRPDLALIDRHYREWWVVEVELAHHPLEGHVVPQVDVFRRGRYNHRHAAALHGAMPSLDLDRLRAMMIGAAPRVLVIVDSPSVASIWRPRLREIDVEVGIVEPFRDARNELILRLNGDQPEPLGKILSRCSRHPMFLRLWKVQSPAALPELDDEELTVFYQGVTTLWKRVLLRDSVMLQPERGDVLQGLSLVNLVRLDDGTLMFEAISARSRKGGS